MCSIEQCKITTMFKLVINVSSLGLNLRLYLENKSHRAILYPHPHSLLESEVQRGQFKPPAPQEALQFSNSLTSCKRRPLFSGLHLALVQLFTAKQLRIRITSPLADNASRKYLLKLFSSRRNWTRRFQSSLFTKFKIGSKTLFS